MAKLSPQLSQHAQKACTEDRLLPQCATFVHQRAQPIGPPGGDARTGPQPLAAPCAVLWTWRAEPPLQAQRLARLAEKRQARMSQRGAPAERLAPVSADHAHRCEAQTHAGVVHVPPRCFPRAAPAVRRLDGAAGAVPRRRTRPQGACLPGAGTYTTTGTRWRGRVPWACRSTRLRPPGPSQAVAGRPASAACATSTSPRQRRMSSPPRSALQQRDRVWSAHPRSATTVTRPAEGPTAANGPSRAASGA